MTTRRVPSVLDNASRVWLTSRMTNDEKIRNAEIMYGTGSRQHLAAIAKFSKPRPTSK